MPKNEAINVGIFDLIFDRDSPYDPWNMTPDQKEMVKPIVFVLGVKYALDHLRKKNKEEDLLEDLF